MGPEQEPLLATIRQEHEEFKHEMETIRRGVLQTADRPPATPRELPAPAPSSQSLSVGLVAPALVYAGPSMAGERFATAFPAYIRQHLEDLLNRPDGVELLRDMLANIGGRTTIKLPVASLTATSLAVSEPFEPALSVRLVSVVSANETNRTREATALLHPEEESEAEPPIALT